jgi:folylpolyglutamate synthase/dihydropteroate synthase
LFRHYQVDVQVLEVGLGGRLDAANLVDADIAVITNIALDHVEWLGDTREKIGAERLAYCARTANWCMAKLICQPVSLRRRTSSMLLLAGSPISFLQV